MTIKYKVNEVAKDLNQPVKDVLELLQKEFGETKKNTSVLTEQELNYIFDYYTQKNQVDNFDAYFQSASQPEKQEKQEPKKAEKKCQDYGNKLTFTFIDNKCKLYEMIHSHTNYFLFCGCLSNIITQRSDFDIILWKKGSFLE